jgi:hypothetical protein
MLVADMGGSLFLPGRNDGPSASVNSPGAGPLKQKLGTALGGTELARRGSQGEAW